MLLRRIPGCEETVERLVQGLRLLAEERRKEPLQIIEIGTRDTAITRQFLNALEDVSVAYTYADSSKYFLQEAEKELAGYERVEFEMLNLEEGMDKQQMSLHSYDIVISVNALHRNIDAADAVKKVAELLKPNGILLMTDLVVRTYLQELTAAFLENGFADIRDKRKEAGLVTPDCLLWRECLSEAGLGEDCAVTERYGRCICCSRQQASVLSYHNGALREYLSEKLPEYMVPQNYHFMEQLPTLSNELMGILGKGSDRSRLLSKNLNVPMYTDIKEINQNVDAACVVVPNAAGGGNGANIAKSILAKGIPTLLEHPAHEVEIVNCIRESGSAAFMLNPFYRYIKPIRDFLEAAQIISKHAHLINASLECAIHVLYDGIDILGCALGGLSTWKLGNVAESYTTSMAGGGNRVISGIIGMVPVTFIVNTNVDRNDIDHPLHLYHRIELTFSTGRLCLVNTHGPVIWLPFLHMPRDEYGTLSINVEEEVNIPSGVTIGNVMLPSVKETFEQIWPDAVKKALEILFKQNRTEKMSMAQYQIYVSKLWSEICQKVGYMNIVDYDNFGDIKNIFYDLEKRHLIKKENDGIE